jgi:hypothetical protein
LADPFPLKDGARPQVEARFDGKPLPDVIIEIGDDSAASRGPHVRTDAHGLATFLSITTAIFGSVLITVHGRDTRTCSPLTTTLPRSFSNAES